MRNGPTSNSVSGEQDRPVPQAGVEPGQVEQLGDQPAEPLGLVERGAQRGGVGRRHPVHDVLQQRLQGRDRCPQLVRDVRDQLTPGPVDLGEVGGHPVEGAGQLADLVP